MPALAPERAVLGFLSCTLVRAQAGGDCGGL